MTILDNIVNSHPSTAQAAKTFISPQSLSFPGGAATLTPPSESETGLQTQGNAVTDVNGKQSLGINTPADTPAQHQGSSGILPTLQ